MQQVELILIFLGIGVLLRWSGRLPEQTPKAGGAPQTMTQEGWPSSHHRQVTAAGDAGDDAIVSSSQLTYNTINAFLSHEGSSVLLPP